MAIGNYCMTLSAFDVRVITVVSPLQALATRLVASLVHLLFLLYDWTKPEMAEVRGQVQLLLLAGGYFLFCGLVYSLFSDGGLQK